MFDFEIRIRTLQDLKESFLNIYLTNGMNALWATDTIEYQFYSRINEAQEKEEQEAFIRSLRLLHGQKQSNF